ncbi:MAG: AAA-like domain-containing protein [Caldilineaceae bacterium]|nr:AAA-like domain-containing protein [Caldilineaceae bacterium]
MTRYFNTHGPVNELEHYIVARDALVTEVAQQIVCGAYFTIFAPRQMGKTTLLRRLRDVLKEQPGFLPITMSFQRFETWPVEEFMAEFGRLLAQRIVADLQEEFSGNVEGAKALIAAQSPNTYARFWTFFDELHQLLPMVKVVLIIDEFDGTPQAAISPLLQTWRDMYLDMPPPRALHSVVLIGIQNLAKLNLGRSSPFNIANQLALPNFSSTQVADLLTQHTRATGQPFASEVITEIVHLTNGYPFLVNRIAAILTEDLVTDRTQPITLADLERARRQLITETNYNFETLKQHANAHREIVLAILFGASREFNLNDPIVNELHMQGIIAGEPGGDCRIANPIYADVLVAALRPPQLGLQADILVNGYDFRPHTSNGKLQMDLLLSRFRTFVERRGREAFKVTPTPQEATGQYLLMAYLSLIVRQAGGDLFTEVDTNTGRMDLIVVHGGERYIIETKIWRGPEAYDDGLDQLAGYLQSENQPTGYYVVFHARPNVYGKLPQEQLEFTVARNNRQIHVYLVRLESVFTD